MKTIDSNYNSLLVKLLAKGVIGYEHKQHLEVNYITVLSSYNCHIRTSHEFRLLNFMQVSQTLIYTAHHGMCVLLQYVVNRFIFSERLRQCHHQADCQVLSYNDRPVTEKVNVFANLKATMCILF